MLFLKKIFFRSLLYLCLHDKMLKINKTKTWKAEISHLFIDIQVYQLYICIEQEKHNRKYHINHCNTQFSSYLPK